MSSWWRVRAAYLHACGALEDEELGTLADELIEARVTGHPLA